MNSHSHDLRAAASWPLAKAKAQLTALVDAALAGTLQTITRHGEDVVVVMSIKQYLDVVVPQGSIVEFFAKSPLSGVKLDIERNASAARKLEH